MKQEERMLESKLKSTAYHEAGHTVIAYLLHARIKSVSIVRTADYLGCFRGKLEMLEADQYISSPFPLHFLNIPTRTRSVFERRVMIALSGDVAERLFTGRKNNAGSGSDYHTVIDFLSPLVNGDKEEINKYYELLRYRTQKVLQYGPFWMAVQDLADGLLKHKQLNVKEIKSIIKGALDKNLALDKAQNSSQSQL